MPCDDPDHVHLWPSIGKLTIWGCEKYCGYCKADKAERKQFHGLHTLKRHVDRMHIKKGEKYQLEIVPSPMMPSRRSSAKTEQQTGERMIVLGERIASDPVTEAEVSPKTVPATTRPDIATTTLLPTQNTTAYEPPYGPRANLQGPSESTLTPSTSPAAQESQPYLAPIADAIFSRSNPSASTTHVQQKTEHRQRHQTCNGNSPCTTCKVSNWNSVYDANFRPAVNTQPVDQQAATWPNLLPASTTPYPAHPSPVRLPPIQAYHHHQLNMPGGSPPHQQIVPYYAPPPLQNAFPNDALAQVKQEIGQQAQQLDASYIAETEWRNRVLDNEFRIRLRDAFDFAKMNGFTWARVDALLRQEGGMLQLAGGT